MKFIERIKEVVGSELLLKDLMSIPSIGVNDEMISKEEEMLPRSLSNNHRLLLKTWNGIDLDRVRVYGIGETEEFIKPLGKEYEAWKEIVDEVAAKMGGKVVLFADDPAGFMYFELESGPIIQLDTDGGSMTKVAEDMSDFFLNYLFGERANEYSGDDWLQELIDAKIIPE